MITRLTEKKIIAACRELAKVCGLEQVYLTEIVGPRRHYIAGYGRPSFEKAGQLQLSDRIMLFWHGTLPPEILETYKNNFTDVISSIEQELFTDRNSE